MIFGLQALSSSRGLVISRHLLVFGYVKEKVILWVKIITFSLILQVILETHSDMTTTPNQLFLTKHWSGCCFWHWECVLAGISQTYDQNAFLRLFLQTTDMFKVDISLSESESESFYCPSILLLHNISSVKSTRQVVQCKYKKWINIYSRAGCKYGMWEYK